MSLFSFQAPRCWPAAESPRSRSPWKKPRRWPSRPPPKRWPRPRRLRPRRIKKPPPRPCSKCSALRRR
ncbi:MAG TPA: hypothetical protein DDW67_10110 [Elusimicrobia bacterium]|nr:hypothetical protein [Elusimicrobiota bacterium]